MYSAPKLRSASPRAKATRIASSPWLEHVVHAVDVAQPDLRPFVDQLGDVRERRLAELDEVLTFQIAFRVLARDGGDARRAVLGERRYLIEAGPPRVRRLEAAGDDADLIAMQIVRGRKAQRLGRHRVTLGLVHYVAVGPTWDGIRSARSSAES